MIPSGGSIPAKLYSVADVFQTSLRESTTYKWWIGTGSVRTTLGPWDITVAPTVWSDEISETAVSAIAKLKGDVWAYLVVYPGDKGMAMVLFNGREAGVSRDSVATFCTGSYSTVLKKIQPHAVATFKYEGKTWHEQAKTVGVVRQ